VSRSREVLLKNHRRQVLKEVSRFIAIYECLILMPSLLYSWCLYVYTQLNPIFQNHF